MASSNLTLARVRELFDYNAETGVFTRLRRVSNRPAGEECGRLDIHSGYVRVNVDGRTYYAHRLAWFWTHGVWPAHDVDHRDRVRHHNWIANLRPVTRAENLQNQIDASPRSASGVRGVSWDKSRRLWVVNLSVNNKNRFVGRFVDLEAAQIAYRGAKVIHHPGAL